MAVPYTFGTATAAIPLSQLDSNFATAITIGNTAVQLGNTVTTLNNMTLANVTINSGTITITNVSVTTANVSGTANISTLVVVGNETVGGNTTITGNITAANANVTTNLVLSGGTANGVAYLNTSKQLTTGTALVFDGTNLGVGAAPTRQLQVTNGTNAIVSVLNGAIEGVFNATTSGVNIGTASNNYLTIGINGAEKVRVSNATGGVGAVGIGYTSLTSVGDNGLAVLGNVGIGTSSPLGLLNIKGSNGQLVLNNGASSGGVRLSAFTNAGTANGYLAFEGYSSEYGRFDSSGNFTVGATSGSWGSASGNQVSPAFQQINKYNGVSGDQFIAFSRNSSTIGSITQSGTTAVLFNVTSDQRLKENIQDAESASSLIDAIQVRQFDWKTDQTHQRYGFVAQELVTVAPEAVHQPTKEEDMMAVDYSKLVPMLVKEIQSLRKRLAAANL